MKYRKVLGFKITLFHQSDCQGIPQGNHHCG